MTVGLKRARVRAVEFDVIIAVCVAAVGAGVMVFLQLVGPSLDPAKMSYVHERHSGQARVFHTKWGRRSKFGMKKDVGGEPVIPTTLLLRVCNPQLPSKMAMK